MSLVVEPQDLVNALCVVKTALCLERLLWAVIRYVYGPGQLWCNQALRQLTIVASASSSVALLPDLLHSLFSDLETQVNNHTTSHLFEQRENRRS
jgi:hypothetical protein